MKKLINLSLIVTMLVSFLVVPVGVGAKTLRTLTTELDQLEASLKETKHQKELTQQQINSIRSNIMAMTNESDQIQNDIKKLNDDIVALNESIAAKDKEIKDVVNFVQISNGESVYLEYAFGAQSFTDFIYRVAISEQLASYNDTLIKKYNEMIIENNTKKEELNTRTITLVKKQNELDIEVNKLGSTLGGFDEESMSIEEEIKQQRAAILMYQELGCKLDEDISTCGRNKLPPDTAFFRPITYGGITSEFGWYDPYNTGSYIRHYGMDFGTNAGNPVSIYSVAAGMVIGVSYGNSCGGNMIFIHHNVNGQTYTSVYMHLRQINVSPKDVVTRNTVIGIMGGDPHVETFDRCSTGRHLHLQIATGLYLKDYSSFDTLKSRSINPRVVINIPTGRNFTDRLTKY